MIRQVWRRPSLILYTALVIVTALNVAQLFYTPGWIDKIGGIRIVPESNIIQHKGDANQTNFADRSSNVLGDGFLYQRLLGQARPKTGFLTIGVPSIKRKNGIEYLVQTLNSLLAETSLEDKQETIVLVFLGDFDNEYNDMAVENLTTLYRTHLNSGFMHIVQASREYYPSLKHLKRNFNDAEDRVYWRSKQVLDFAFMFKHGQSLSTYYLQLEDDVICSANFVPKMKRFIKSQSRRWTMLEFSELGFIGKLFKSIDLPRLSTYLKMFFEEQPVDWLIHYYRMSMSQMQRILCKPTLFQHRGIVSSFNKSQILKDRYFDSGIKRWSGDDPPASLTTSMVQHNDFVLSMCYNKPDGFFWALRVKAGNFLRLVFDKDKYLDKIMIDTGIESFPKDIMEDGVLEVDQQPSTKRDKPRGCGKFVTIGKFDHGQLAVDNLQQILKGKLTRCVQVTAKKDLPHWVIFRQIAIFIKKK